MKSLLKGHRRTKSAEISVVASADVPDASHILRSSSSFQQMALAYKNGANGSSQSLRKLNPMSFLRRTSLDAGRRMSAGSARTGPVLSLDECRDCGVIYGTRTHYWGVGRQGSIIIREGEEQDRDSNDTERFSGEVMQVSDTVAATDAPCSPPISSSQVFESDSDSTLDSPASAIFSSPSISQCDASASDPPEPENEPEEATDTASLYSFDDNSGIGRNRSVNYYKTLNLSSYMYSTATHTLNDGDIDEDDLSYDNFLDEVNAVPEDFADQLSFRSSSTRSSASQISSASSTSSSLKRRQSSVLRKTDHVTTLYSPEVIGELEREWNIAGGTCLTSSLAPISEG